MKTLGSMNVAFAALGLAAVALGCATPAADEAREADVDSLTPQAMITNANADGTWTATALKPVGEDSVNGVATFTGPSGKTRKMGVCVIREYRNTSNLATSCTTVADCGSSPSYLPTGGSRYCTSADNSGGKSCFYRPGTQASLCAGSPANGGVAVAPGTFVTGPSPGATTSQFWISYACFEGCTASDPSASSLAATAYNWEWCDAHGWPLSCPPAP